MQRADTAYMLRLPRETRDAWHAWAEREGCSLAELIRRAMLVYAGIGGEVAPEPPRTDVARDAHIQEP